MKDSEQESSSVDAPLIDETQPEADKEVSSPKEVGSPEEVPVDAASAADETDIWKNIQSKMDRAKSMVFAATSPIPFHYVTVRNIKLFAFLVTLCFIIYHGSQRRFGNNDTCEWLLREGRVQGNNLWQPNGCMMHVYTQAQARVCIRQTRSKFTSSSAVFIGDSRLRYLFNATVKHITGSEPVYPEGKHKDLAVTDQGLNLTMKFYWKPFVDQDMQKQLDNIKDEMNRAGGTVPFLVLVSSGTWTMKTTNASEAAFKEYKKNLTDLSPSLDDIAKKTRVLWVLQDPVFERLLSPERAMIDNSQISKYNWAAEEIFRGSNVRVWSSSHLVFWYLGDSKDGIHMGNEGLRQTVQIFLNYHCNHEMRHRDATCCINAEPLHSMQIAALSIFGVFILTAIVVLFREYGTVVARNLRMYMKRQPLYTNGSAFHDKPLTIRDARLPKKVKTRHEVFCETMMALGKLGLIMGYFVLCDRTDFFKKENKYYSNVNFFVPLTYIFLIGLFFSENSDQSGLLHRDQTDDWKGWMQFVILVYHFTAGSTQLPIYMHVRTLVSSYLFLNGYAHFMYFWNKADISAYRFFQIVFRMNLLVFCLCIFMNRQYQFYYFVPLVTFWFIVTYLTMALPPRVSEASAATNSRHYVYMIIKFILVFGLITTLYISEDFFGRIFMMKPWAALFRLGDNIHEWFFRWKLDRYSVLQGMVFGFLVAYARKHGWFNEGMSQNLFNFRPSMFVLAGGFVGLFGYSVFTFVCPRKEQCNEIHSYVVWAPILGFIAVRNVFGVVRRRYSTLFAWAGRVSLELFIVQFHVWLAADTYGILVFIPGYPMLNVILTSFIYVCVAHEVHVVTGVLAEHLVPKDWRYLSLAVALFGILLGVLAVCYGL